MQPKESKESLLRENRSKKPFCIINMLLNNTIELSKKMQDTASGNNIRTVLITCIITACFENPHGNQDTASTQLQSGIALLQEWKRGERDAARYPMGFSSPAPDVIKDYLVYFFGRLEIVSVSKLDN